jgi:hypothetical protein
MHRPAARCNPMRRPALLPPNPSRRSQADAVRGRSASSLPLVWCVAGGKASALHVASMRVAPTGGKIHQIIAGRQPCAGAWRCGSRAQLGAKARERITKSDTAGPASGRRQLSLPLSSSGGDRGQPKRRQAAGWGPPLASRAGCQGSVAVPWQQAQLPAAKEWDGGGAEPHRRSLRSGRRERGAGGLAAQGEAQPCRRPWDMRRQQWAGGPTRAENGIGFKAGKGL